MFDSLTSESEQLHMTYSTIPFKCVKYTSVCFGECFWLLNRDIYSLVVSSVSESEALSLSLSVGTLLCWSSAATSTASFGGSF